MPNTTTIVVTVLLTRENGHDITPTALKRAMLVGDLAGLEIEHDDIVVHDISEGKVTRVNEWHIAVTYHVEVEVDTPRRSPMHLADLITLVDDAACFCPDEGWGMARSTVTLHPTQA